MHGQTRMKRLVAEALGQVVSFGALAGPETPDEKDEVSVDDAKVKDQVIDLLASGKGERIPDEKVHALADKLGVEHSDLESLIYSFASQWAMNQKAQVNPGGRAEKKGVTSKDFPRKVIEKGIEVELEHTKDRWLAEKIVLDHLAEDPKYYEKLLSLGL